MARRRRGVPKEQALWAEFSRRHPGNAFLQSDVLYSLNQPLIDAIKTEIPGFFTADQERFERALAKTASFGFFHGRALGYNEEAEQASRQARTAKSIDDMLKEEYRRSGIPDADVAEYESQAIARRNTIATSKHAYVGWLVSNREFRTEVSALSVAWGNVVRTVGKFPVFPRWPLHDRGEEFPEGLRDDFQAFYQRWGLEQMLTWEWPVPMEPDLVGGMVKESDLISEAGLALFVPWYLLRTGKLDLRELARGTRSVNTPAHLSEWVQKSRRKQDELCDLRYERLASLYRFLVLGLRQRYPQQCRRQTNKLDYALARALDLKDESIRKSRLELQRSLANDAPSAELHQAE